MIKTKHMIKIMGKKIFNYLCDTVTIPFEIIIWNCLYD